MPASRPTSVTVMAIFHIIIGGLGLAGDLCTLVLMGSGGQSFLMSLGGPEQQKLQEKLLGQLETLPYYQVYKIGNAVTSIVFSIALLAAGIALLRMKSWGRTLSLVYAVFSILTKVLLAYYTAVYFAPAYVEGMRTMMQEQEKKLEEQQKPGQKIDPQVQQKAAAVRDMTLYVMQIGMNIMPYVQMIYPLVTLLVLGRPSVGRALRPSDGSAPVEDYYDDRTEVDPG
jgi:hypothetical protein